MQTKWNIGGCGTECGSSGVTTTCPCTACLNGNAAQSYLLGFRADPGLCTFGVTVQWFSYDNLTGYCTYRSSSFAWLGNTVYAEAELRGGGVVVKLKQVSDDSVVMAMLLLSADGTNDCQQKYVYDAARGSTYSTTTTPLCVTPDDDPDHTYFEPVTYGDLHCTESLVVVPPGSGNCCPCPSGEPCGVFAERWDRADSTDLGDDWEEIAGDWEITSHRATIGSAHAIAKPNGMYVAYSAKMVEAVCTGAEGDRIRLMPAYDDADNYKFAEWEVGSGGFLRVGVRSGGSDTIVHTTYVDTVPGQYYRFRACGTAWLTAQLTGSGVDRYSSGNVTGPGTMTVVAIGTGSAATDVRFADVHVWRATSEDCVECLGFVPDCSTNCCPDDLLPITAYVTIGAGWTDADCTRCNEVAATYALDHISSPHGTWFYACNGGLWACCWGFEEAWCQSTAFGVYQYRLHVSAAILPAATPGRCFYRVNVVLGYQAGGGGPTSVLGAYYDGPEFDGTDSCRGQFTVTKVAETFTGSAPRPCNGTLPTTLLLEIP